MKKLLVSLSIFTFLWACNSEKVNEQTPAKKNILVQVSVIDALLQGIYDGIMPISELVEYGDLGIGTFHGLNGEMVVLNDTVFQVLSTGAVAKPASDVTTPFAAITAFSADTTFALEDISYDSLEASFNSFFPTPNLFYAVKMKGEFSYMKTRSVPAQSEPYLPLAEVTKNQPEFEFNQVKGEIVGFYCPAYAQGINVTGLHLHFLTADRKGGGHILAFNVKKVSLEIGYLPEFKLILPTSGDFLGGDFTVDRSEDLEQAEN
ncbi:MAG: acetolactate decarboxylase [Bacteroidales bacterium]|nr:acetolactate decarboxylase [Bacteroidales bacterium]